MSIPLPPLPEPVAYRSSRNNGKTWIITEGDPADLMPDVGGIVIPLYAAPPAAPAQSNQLSGNSGALNLIAPAPVVPAKCDGGTCGLGGYCADCPKQSAAPVVPLMPRELELIDGMIEVQLHHAAQCDHIANRTMAEKQKGWDMERVELLRKLRGIGGGNG